MHAGTVQTIAHERLTLLKSMYDMHIELNHGIEHDDNTDDVADFYTCAKVDTHIHLAAAFSAQKFLEFIRTKCKTCSDDIVFKGRTLAEVVEEVVALCGVGPPASHEGISAGRTEGVLHVSLCEDGA